MPTPFRRGAVLAALLLLGAAPNAAAVTLCSFSCPTDPSTPGPAEVEWDFVLVLSLAVGESLSLDVDGNVYLHSPNGLYDGNVLALAGSEIVFYAGSSSISLVADSVALDGVGPDCMSLACVAGDVYVEVDPPFGDLEIGASGQIYASDEAILFVPEPAAGALLAVGLAGLAVPLSRRGSPGTRGSAPGRR